MTLTETLQLKEKFLKYEDLRALDYCERRWQQEGCPAERWQLINFLERMLRELQANGPGYPKVLLLRKKEIQRKEFTVSLPADEPNGADVDVCSLCYGTGWAKCGGGHSPCSCPLGNPHREQLRKWGMQI